MNPAQILEVLNIPLWAVMLIAILFFVIFIHEMGHLFAARLLKIPVESVVIGKGRALKKWQDRKSTQWEIRLLPFTAYVKIPALSLAQQKSKGAEDIAYWKRLFIFAGGPLTNLLLPVLLFPLFYAGFGIPSQPAVVAGVEIGLAADRAGIEPGDEFLAVDGIPFKNFQDVWDIAYAKGPVTSIYTIKRGDQIFERALKPGWEAYKEDGIDRANARFGIVWEHRAFSLKMPKTINGQEINANTELARALIIENMEKTAIVELEGSDGKIKPVKMKFSAQANAHLFDKDHALYDAFYFGDRAGNFYLHVPPSEAVMKGVGRAFDMVANIARLPLQLLPFDPKVISVPYPVHDPDTKTANFLAGIIHVLSFVSIFIGLLNILPLPYFDGGHIYIQSIEVLKKRLLSNKEKAHFFVVSFLLIYLTVFTANMDNLPYYIDSRFEKFQELVSTNTDGK